MHEFVFGVVIDSIFGLTSCLVTTHLLNFVFQKLGTIQKNSILQITTKCVFSKVLGLLLKDVMCYVVLYMFIYSMNNYFVAHD